MLIPAQDPQLEPGVLLSEPGDHGNAVEGVAAPVLDQHEQIARGQFLQPLRAECIEPHEEVATLAAEPMMDVKDVAALLSTAISLLAYLRGSLAPSGVAGAILVGTLTFGFGGWTWGVLLGVFFVTSSLLSHFKEQEKRLAAEKFDKSHRRDLAQTLANGGAGALAALLSAFYPAPIWFPFFLGITATVNADTWATELGTLSARPPRLITSGRVVEVGTSGGVSPLGTAVSLAGGLTIGLVAALTRRPSRPWSLLLSATIAGLAGSFFDSLLGATVQQIYYCDNCQKETERKLHKCGHATRPLRGWSWLNNDLVNLLASLVGGLVALGLHLLWKEKISSVAKKSS